jgi:stringent starvation protein B
MLSNKPYLLRAFNEWIIDSQCTPILVLDAMNPRCKIPKDFAEGGEIVFNISPNAIRDLKMTNECVEFKASFSGVIHIIYAPINAILAVYAEENGEGLFFDAEDDALDSVATPASMMTLNSETKASEVVATTKSKPFLTLVE